MTKAFDIYSKWWMKTMSKRANKDPWYAEIEAKRHSDTEQTGTLRWLDEELTMEDWERQTEIEDKVAPRNWTNPLGVPWQIHWFLQRRGFHATRGEVRARWQRSKRGFSHRDTWALNSYLGNVIADSVEELRKNVHGYPCALSEEKWDEVLGEIIDGFRAGALYSDELDEEKSKEMYAKFRRGGFLFIRHFGSLWD